MFVTVMNADTVVQDALGGAVIVLWMCEAPLFFLARLLLLIDEDEERISTFFADKDWPFKSPDRVGAESPSSSLCWSQLSASVSRYGHIAANRMSK